VSELLLYSFRSSYDVGPILLPPLVSREYTNWDFIELEYLRYCQSMSTPKIEKQSAAATDIDIDLVVLRARKRLIV
jgi:hypothetical protein